MYLGVNTLTSSLWECDPRGAVETRLSAIAAIGKGTVNNRSVYWNFSDRYAVFYVTPEDEAQKKYCKYDIELMAIELIEHFIDTCRVRCELSETCDIFEFYVIEKSHDFEHSIKPGFYTQEINTTKQIRPVCEIAERITSILRDNNIRVGRCVDHRYCIYSDEFREAEHNSNVPHLHLIGISLEMTDKFLSSVAPMPINLRKLRLNRVVRSVCGTLNGHGIKSDDHVEALGLVTQKIKEGHYLDSARRRGGIERVSDAPAAKPIEALSLPSRAPLFYRDRDRSLNIEEFLRAVWLPWIHAGVLSRPDLRRLDPGAYAALQDWLRTNTLPTELQLPTKKQIVDRELADPERLRAARRVLRTHERRNKAEFVADEAYRDELREARRILGASRRRRHVAPQNGG